MKILVAAWNAQGTGVSGNSVLSSIGNTWEILLDKYLFPFYHSEDPVADIFLGLIVEAGRPPGVDTHSHGTWKGHFNTGVLHSIYYWQAWNPGSTNHNLRCSLAGLQCYDTKRLRGPICQFSTHDIVKGIRPCLYTKINNNYNNNLIICLVHLPSGAHYNFNIKLLVELWNDLIKACNHFVILGDMNINLLDQNAQSAVVNAFGQHNLLSTNRGTQRSSTSNQHPELDWGLSYNCNVTVEQLGPLHGTNAGIGFGTIAKGISDHAVLGYTIKF